MCDRGGLIFSQPRAEEVLEGCTSRSTRTRNYKDRRQFDCFHHLPSPSFSLTSLLMASRPDSVTGTPRRLPATPQQSKRASRPLPKIPRALVCKQCATCITSHNFLLPSSAVSLPSHSHTCLFLVLTIAVLDSSRFAIFQRLFWQSIFVYRNVSFASIHCDRLSYCLVAF